MKVSLVLVVTLILGALAANFLLQDNGYVLISFRGTVVEMSVPVLLMLLLLAYIATRIIVRIWHVPRRLGEYAARRRTRKAGELITRGYIELGQGNFARGEKLLTRGARNSATPLLNYLAAARAAQAQGDSGRRDNWLEMASEQEPRARVTVLLTRAELQQAAGEAEAAGSTLDEVLLLAPNNSAALRLKAEHCVAASAWSELETVLPRLRRHGKGAPLLLDQWTVNTWAALLQADGTDARRIRQLMSSLPRGLRAHPAIVAAHARARVALGEAAQAEALLRKALARNWSSELVLLYSEQEGGDPARRLQWLEDRLEAHPDDPDLLLAAARLCVQTELWGKARSYYETSAGLRKSAQTLHELGQLLLRIGDKAGAYVTFQQALESGSGPGVPLPRLTTGHFAADGPA